MGYTPSGVSHMADAVEAELGVTILQRGRGGVSLTNAGAALFSSMRELVRSETLLKQQAAELTGIDKGTVTIGSYPSIASQWLPQIMMDFHRNYPRIKMQLMEGTHQELDQWMDEYKLDFCIYTYLPGGSDHEWIPLREDQMVVVLPPDHPLSGKGAIRAEEINGQPFIMPAGGHDRDVMLILDELAIKPDIQFSTIENIALLSMIRCGLGISIMNRLVTSDYADRVAVRPLDPPRHCTMGIALPSLKNASPAARKMIQYIRHAVERNAQGGDDEKRNK